MLLPLCDLAKKQSQKMTRPKISLLLLIYENTWRNLTIVEDYKEQLLVYLSDYQDSLLVSFTVSPPKYQEDISYPDIFL